MNPIEFKEETTSESELSDEEITYESETDSEPTGRDSLAAYFIFYKNSRCSDCERYIIFDYQKDWEFKYIFREFDYHNIIAYEGGSGKMCK